MRGITIENEETDGENFEFFGIFPVLIYFSTKGCIAAFNNRPLCG